MNRLYRSRSEGNALLSQTISRLEIPDRFTGIRIWFSLTVPSVSAPRVRTNTALRRSHTQYKLHTLSLSLSLSLHPPSLQLSACVIGGDIAQLL